MPLLLLLLLQSRDGSKAKEQLVDRAVALFRTRVLRPVPTRAFPLKKWREALAAAAENSDKVLLCSAPLGEGDGE